MFIRGRFSPREGMALSMLSKTVQVTQTLSLARGSLRRGEDSSAPATCPTLPTSPGVEKRPAATVSGITAPDPTGGFLGLSRASTSRKASTRVPGSKRAEGEPVARGTAIAADLTLRGMVLVAAEVLDAEGVVLTLPALSVRCWRLWPGSFGLGTTPHPDSARVSAEIAKLTAAGMLSRPALGVVEITEAGRETLTGARGAR